MHIVDSQHIWGADTPERPWPPGRAHQAQKPYPFTRAMLLGEMDAAGVSRVVTVPPWEGVTGTADWLWAATERTDISLEHSVRNYKPAEMLKTRLVRPTEPTAQQAKKSGCFYRFA